MENSDGKLNELISDLSEPARSTVAAIVRLQKIPTQILIRKNISGPFLKSITKATRIETDDSHVESRLVQEARQFALNNDPRESVVKFVRNKNEN